MRQAYATGRINQVAISKGCVKHKMFGVTYPRKGIYKQGIDFEGYITYRYTQYWVLASQSYNTREVERQSEVSA